MKTLRAIALSLLVAASAGCGGGEPEEAEVLRPVESILVAYGQTGTSRAFSGTAQTDKTVNLSFRSAGIITRFDLTVGSRVRRGQLLAELDNVQARLAHEQAISALNSAESQMNTARLAYDRIRSLYELGSAALSEFESAKNSFRTAEASYQSALRSVEIQDEQVRYGYIYAPESGIIASVFSELDENVGAGQVVAVLNAGSEIEVLVGLPESIINSVEDGGDVRVTFAAVEGVVFNGRVTEVSPSLDAQTATFPVRVLVFDATSAIRSGMTASVRFDFGGGGDTEDQIIIPAKAVGEDADGNFVFVVDDASSSAVVRKARVTIGTLSSSGFEILEGLSEGQRVATAGLQTLLDGQRVRMN